MPKSAWNDNDGDHEDLVQYCNENGLKINFVYSKLIRAFLKNPNIIK